MTKVQIINESKFVSEDEVIKAVIAISVKYFTAGFLNSKNCNTTGSFYLILNKKTQERKVVLKSDNDFIFVHKSLIQYNTIVLPWLNGLNFDLEKKIVFHYNEDLGYIS